MRKLIILGLPLLIILGFISIKKLSNQDKLIWSDEFTGNKVLADNWVFELGDGCPDLCGWGNREMQEYTDNLQNVRLENGKLVIEAVKNDGKWTSARIKTQGKFKFTYGRVEISAKLPKGVGTWPAIWMLGDNITEVGWPECGEIDIMEFAGKNPDLIHGSIHNNSSHGATENTRTIKIGNASEEFHTYSINWTSESITYSIDGKEFYKYSPETKNTDNWPFDNSFFLLVNMAIGGGFGSNPRLESDGLKNGIEPSLKNARFEIDYIRVYDNGYTISKAGN